MHRRKGATYTKAQSAPKIILKLVLVSIIWIVLSTINLQLQGGIVPISLKPLLGIVQDGVAYGVATVWSSSG